MKIFITDEQYWTSYNEERLKKILEGTKSGASVARNVIIFIGDGMGIQTITAGRIFKGQSEKHVSGEESELVWDSFPHTGFSKVSNIFVLYILSTLLMETLDIQYRQTST